MSFFGFDIFAKANARTTRLAERRWAIVRILLGFGQVFGASLSLGLLIKTGINKLSLGSAVVTGLLTTVSVLLFGGRGKGTGGGAGPPPEVRNDA